MLSLFSQPLYSTVLNENQITCFHFSSDVQYSILRSYKHKIGIREFQLRRIEFNVPRTNISMNSARY